jgi:outer membrane protein assembly factor BamB
MSRALIVVAGCGLLAGTVLGGLGPNAGATRLAALDTRLSRASVRELTIVWRGATGGGISSSPAVAGGVVYVGSNDGFLFAFDAKAGLGCRLFGCAPLWRGATGGAVTSSPAVANGIVYVGSSDGRLYAFDATRCAQSPTIPCAPTWVGSTAGPVTSSPTVVNGVVYVGSDDGRLYAFDAAGCLGAPASACRPRWRAFTSGPVSSSPAVASGLVYVGSENGRLYAFDASGCAGAPATPCREVWRGVTGGPVRSSPAVALGAVYVGSDDGRLYAFDASGCAGAPATACRPLWRGVTNGPVSSSPAVADGVIYVGSDDGHLYAFAGAGTTACSGAPKVCSPRWVGQTRGPVSSSPAVGNGVVYVGSDDQHLYGFATNNGTNVCSNPPRVCVPVWVGAIGGAVASSPAVVSGGVYVGSSAGSLVSLRAVVEPISPTLASGVITPDRDDTYALFAAGNTVTASAPGSNVSLNTRVAFWRRNARVTSNEQSCATWAGQSAAVNQEGAVLRVRELANGVRRGILVTKNVWLGANWIFNVHVWSTGWPEVYEQIAHFDLGPVLAPYGQLVPLPWRLCARVVGNVVSFIVWPANQTRPSWEDASHGGRVVLPEGWSAPGYAGWYIGHLRLGDTATLTNLASGPVAPDENASRGSVRAPTSPPLAPAVTHGKL